MNKQRDTQALVLGARQGNIGGAIADVLDNDGWDVVTHDCQMSDGGYGLPSVPWAESDALVVTLGKEGITPFSKCSEDDVLEIIDACLVLPLLCIRMWVQGRLLVGLGGKCVVLGSYAYDHSPTSCVPYCAAKAGLAHAINGLGWELTADGFNFHIVHPYHVPSTPMGARVVEAMVQERGFTVDEAEEYQKKDMKLDHHLTPAEIAEYVRWLVVAPEAAWLSGQGLSLYGGVR